MLLLEKIKFHVKWVVLAGFQNLSMTLLVSEIILGKVNEIYSNIMKFNRLTGRYNSDSIFYGKTKEDEKRITDTGTCIKIKKAF